VFQPAAADLDSVYDLAKATGPAPEAPCTQRLHRAEPDEAAAWCGQDGRDEAVPAESALSQSVVHQGPADPPTGATARGQEPGTVHQTKLRANQSGYGGRPQLQPVQSRRG